MYYKMFAALFQVTCSLLFKFGVIPTFRVIFNVFISIYRKNRYNVLTKALEQLNLNTFITAKILDVLAPF